MLLEYSPNLLELKISNYVYQYQYVLTLDSFSFETSDGISRDEQGVLENVGTDEEAIEVRGSFTYTGDDGVVYAINYIAGKDGFVPEGAHLPKA